MSILDATAAAVAKTLLPETPSQLVGRRRGVVLTVNAVTPPTVDVALGTTTLPGVRFLESYTPAAGDVVFVDFTGPDPVVIGTTAANLHQSFLGDVSIAGAATVGGAATIAGLLTAPSIEVRSTTGDAYIDFTRTPGTGDYNVRLINNANGRLTLAAPDLAGSGLMIDGAWLRIKGNRGLFFEDWGGGWWMTDATWLRAYGDKGIYTAGEIQTGLQFNARNLVFMGPSGGHGTNYAQFSHWDQRNSAGGYGYMQAWDGNVYISAAAGTATHMRINNTLKLLIGNDSIEPKTNLALYDNYIRSRAWNDDWHVWHWWSGNDGMRITEYGGLYFRVRDMDPAFEIFAYASARFNRFDQLGGWDTSVLQVRSSGGGSPAMIGWWEAGRGAAHIIKSWFSALECRNWDNGWWGIFRGELEDYSSAQAKRNIRSATERLPKAERKAKVKRLRTTHFNRPRGGCANCLGTGLKRENRRLNPGMSDHEKREALPAVVGLFGGALDESPCPDCDGQGRNFKRPHEVKTEEAGWFGFVAEEVEKEFPEAVYYRPSEADQNVIEVSGLSVQALVAILWEEVKDLEDRLVLVEKGK